MIGATPVPWDPATVKALSAASVALGRLDGMLSTTPHAAEFAALCVLADRCQHGEGRADLGLLDAVLCQRLEAGSRPVPEHMPPPAPRRQAGLHEVAARAARRVATHGPEPDPDLAAMLVGAGLLPVPAICPALGFVHRGAQIRRLAGISDGPQTSRPLLRLMLDIVAEAAGESIDRLESFGTLLAERRQLVDANRLGRYSPALLDLLVTQPLVNVRFVVERLGATPTTAGVLLDAFVGLGVVTEITGRRRGRLFRDTDLLDVFVSPSRRTGPAAPSGQDAWHDEQMIGGSDEVRRGPAVGADSPLADWVPIVTQRIFERSPAKRIVVFGSVARGEDSPGSDLDLLVVLDHVTNSHDDAARVMRTLRDLPVPVDVIVTDEERLQEQARFPGVVRVALREGKVVERAA